MKESKILVQEATGSVVSDNAINILQGEARNVADLSRKVGQLEGEIQVLRNRNMDLDQKLQNQEKQVTVTLRSDKGSNDYTYAIDPWSGLWVKKGSNDKTYIDKITTINIDNLETLINNAVRDEANALIAEADKEIEKANKKAKSAEEMLENYKKTYNNELNALNEKINKAVEKAEKANLDTIAKLTSENKTKEKQLESNKRELNLFTEERDLIVETLNVQIDMLNKQIALLKTKPADLFKAIRAMFYNYRYSRRISSSMS